MSERWEESLRRWYETSPTANLEYLNLESYQKVTNQHLANNISFNIDKTIASSRFHAKLLKKVQEEQTRNQEDLQSQIEQLQQDLQQQTRHIRQLEETISGFHPLTSGEVRSLVSEITKQPKLAEQEALRLTEELKKQVLEVKQAVSDLKAFITS